MFSITVNHRSLATALCSTILATTALVPAATAIPQDLRSPDNREAAPTSSLAGTTSQPSQVLWSNDARDTATSATPVSESSSSSGFDWASAGIGIASAAGVLLIVVALLGSHRSVVRRRVTGT